MSPLSSSDGQGWQELKTSLRRQCPKLFYQFSTQRESLTLCLTDLMGIWEVSLDKYDILAAAARQHTSIDPSVSPKQFGVLLSKIGTSLSDGQNTITRGTERNSYTLLLRTTSDLPRPLKPLEWTFTLEPKATSELAERILRPSLHEVAVSQSKINSLVSTIKEKDHIISRLLDRIGNSAVDLSLVFPGIAGFASRKGGHVSVVDAKKYVPGMAEFEESTWTKEFANEDGYEGADRTGLGNLVKGCEKCFAHSRAEHDSWVKDLPTKNEAQQAPKDDDKRNSVPKKSNKRKSVTDDDSTDEDFERQPTPPGMKSKDHTTKKSTQPLATENDEIDNEVSPPAKRSKHSEIRGLARRDAPIVASKDHPRRATPPISKTASPARRASSASTSTASEDEETEYVKLATSPRRAKSPQSGSKPRLGKLNKKTPTPAPSTSATPTPTPSPSPERRQPPRNAKEDKQNGSARGRGRGRQAHSPTADASDDNDAMDLDRSSPPPAKSKPPSKPVTPSNPTRLGRLGGIKKQPSPSKSASASATPEAASNDEKQTTSPPPRRKLGKLGSVRKKDKDTDPTSSPSSKANGKTKANHQGRATDSDSMLSPCSAPSPEPPSKHLRSKEPDPDLDPSNQASASPPKEPTPPPKKQETAEEAAARRRMELKRTIEAGGGRKKRRF